MKRIITYNVNGIRSAIGKGLFYLIRDEDPDIICFQETKASPGQMMEDEFLRMGYRPYLFSAQRPGYSGVAIFSRQPAAEVLFGMSSLKYDQEGRVVLVDFGHYAVISVYFPSGTTGGIRQNYKMEFLVDFQEYLKKIRESHKNLIISGDYNICRLWIDIHNPDKQLNTSGFLPEERDWFVRFLEDGYIDSFREVNDKSDQYTWWSYRAGARRNNKGWRIDYHIVTNELKDRIIDCRILPQYVQSDHCPVVLDLDV